MKLIDKDESSYRLFFEQEACFAVSYILNPAKNYEWGDLPDAVLLLSETSHHFRCLCTPYTVFNNFLRILWLLLENIKSKIKESSRYLLRLHTGSFENILHFINDLDNSGYIFIAQDHHCFDDEEYDYKNQISIIDNTRDILTSSSLYKGHEKSLSKLLEEDKKSREKYNYPKLLKFTPRELIKEVIACYDENISEIPVNSFAYRSTLFQNLRNYISFFRELAKGLTDDWKKDREYLKEYDFNIPEVKEAIPPTDEELEELVKKYSVVSENNIYFGIESYRDGEKIEDAFHFEAEGKYSLKVKASKPGEYRLLSEMFGKEGLITQELARLTVSECIKEPVYFKNEYDLPVKFDEYFEAACDLPDNYIDSMIIPGASLGFASLKLERLSD